jgi:hypothetical protein
MPLALAGRVAAFSLLAAVSCRPASVNTAPPQAAPAPVQPAPDQVLDALGSGDRAWTYMDGRRLREAVLPDLLRATGALRVDLGVGISTLATLCGFQPLLSIDELFATIWREPSDRNRGWVAVARVEEPLERNVACLRALAPEAKETSLDGYRSWQLKKAFVVWKGGAFVVASSAFHAHAAITRMAHPEPVAAQARAELAGVLLAASVAESDSFGLDALKVRWTGEPRGTKLVFQSRFAEESRAMRAETILRDGLRQMLGSSASLDPAVQGLAERLVQDTRVNRDGAKLDVTFGLPQLAGQTATVERLTALSVRGVRQYTAWDLMGEARVAVFDIARALADYTTEQRGRGRPVRFPPSAPLLPDEVPYGKRVAPNPHAFSFPSWQDIHYTNDRPTFYACDFVTAKDGKSVVVRARGDIDGDGITSLFELDVRLDAKGVATIAPLIRERDPEE